MIKHMDLECIDAECPHLVEDGTCPLPQCDIKEDCLVKRLQALKKERN